MGPLVLKQFFYLHMCEYVSIQRHFSNPTGYHVAAVQYYPAKLIVFEGYKVKIKKEKEEKEKKKQC